MHTNQDVIDILQKMCNPGQREYPMERLNLNIPAEARRKLKELAAATGKKEAELARHLLLDSLERARREQFLSRIEERWTDEAADRLVEICRAMEGLHG